jgi:hypothetical protein
VSRWPASGHWSSGGVTRSAATKGANLGFASVFDEIPDRGSSICRGFGLMISCVCRTPSPSPLIRLGFNFDRIPLGFFSWGRNFMLRFVTGHGEGDDSARATPGPRRGGEGGTESGWGWALPGRKEKKGSWPVENSAR